MKTKLVIFCMSSLVLGCGQYNSENLALGINKNLNERARKKLLPIGATRLFEVKATVESDQGVETKEERVNARVLGYRTADIIREKHLLNFQNGGVLLFRNRVGDTFIIENRPKSGPFRHGFFSGGRIKYVNGKNLRIRGVFDSIDVPGSIPDGYLWRKNAVNRYGFRILKYEVADRGRVNE